MSKQPKPEPVVMATCCSLCGLDWDAHGNKPTALTCIELLQEELRERPRVSWTLMNASNTQTTGGYLTPVKPPDDPDMGVTANVG